MYNLTTLRSNVKSFTVVEVLIAMIVIVLTLSAAIMTTRGSFASDQDSLDYGIAENLAQEGLEMVKNVIDTNLLKYSAYKDQCWNYWLQKDTINSQCSGINEPIIEALTPGGYYTVHIDVDGVNPNPDGYDMAIKLKGNDDPTPTPYLAISGNEAKFRLSKVQIAGAGPVNLYANYDNMAGDQIPYTKSSDTKFYRSVYLTYDNNGDNQISDEYIDYDGDGSPDTDHFSDIIVASKVWWQSHGRIPKVQVKTKLYNNLD